MSKKTLLIITIICAGGFMLNVQTLKAQNAFDALRYSTQYPGGGALNMAMPGSGVTQGLDLGSTLDNPASAGLFDNSGTFLGLSFRNVSETGTYLGNEQDANENHTTLSDIGFAYKMPTSQGSLVFGAGYMQTADYDRALSVSGYNNQTTITDMYNQSGFYGDAAYNAFAIDSIGSRTQSVLRFGGYQGIEQQVQLLESGQMGELTGFLATEFQKNLFLGVSLSIPLATYSYERTFIERDTRNLYTVEGPTYDVDEIFSVDEIDATISGFRARVGMIYKLPDNFSVGINYQFRSSLQVEEEYSTLIESTFDTPDADGNFSYFDEFDGSISYDVETPSRLSAGVALEDIGGFTMTITGEWVNYDNIEMHGIDPGIDFDENQFIRDNFQDVINMKGGISYEVSPLVKPYFGYAYYPDPDTETSSDQTFISGGVNLGRETELNLNLGFQYARWDDQVTFYSVETSPGSFLSERAQEDIGRLQVVVGVSYRF